jgi:adenylate kinase
MSDPQEKYRTFLIFGAPGSGKGTQGKVVGGLPGFVHVACGDVFRALDPHSELGQIFLQYSSRGQLVPDDFTIQLWYDHLQKMIRAEQFRPAEDLLILDGIPRNVAQAEILDQYIDVQRLLYLECTDPEALIARLKRRALHENRLDDAHEDVIRARLAAFEDETAPVIAYYPPEKVVRLNGVQTPLQVLRDVVNAMEEALHPSEG